MGLDDDEEVCAEAMASSLDTYRIKRGGSWSLKKGQFLSFPKAVESLLEKL